MVKPAPCYEDAMRSEAFAKKGTTPKNGGLLLSACVSHSLTLSRHSNATMKKNTAGTCAIKPLVLIMGYTGPCYNNPPRFSASSFSQTLFPSRGRKVYIEACFISQQYAAKNSRLLPAEASFVRGTIKTTSCLAN